MKTQATYGIDWSNVDLSSQYERDQNILEPYDFDTLLLEIGCNIRDINKETVKAHFNEILNAKIRVAKEIFSDNLNNIVKQAKKEREQ